MTNFRRGECCFPYFPMCSILVSCFCNLRGRGECCFPYFPMCSILASCFCNLHGRTRGRCHGVYLCSEYLCFRFPLNPNLKKLWAKAIRRKNWHPKSWERVCSAHFDVDDYIIRGSRKLLKQNAVPSKFNFPSYLQPKKSRPRQTRVSQGQNATISPPLSSDEETDACIDSDVSFEVDISYLADCDDQSSCASSNDQGNSCFIFYYYEMHFNLNFLYFPRIL